VLVAPLDWGLGHATRCIPIINEFLKIGCEVIIACDGPQKKLLEDEFPTLDFFDLRGYRVRYSTNKGLTFLKIILQAPKILIQINRENKWLSRFLMKERVDVVVSDNRYGLHAQGLCSVFITHQLHISTGSYQFFGRKISGIASRYINQFSYCWVPDQPGPDSLAGRLSIPHKFTHIPVRYIGPLSRMKKIEGVEKKWDLLIMLSGPEPQRTILEKKFLGQLHSHTARVLFVRGLPGEQSLPEVGLTIHIVNHLSGQELNQALCASELVICRAGYTSIMELMSLGKKCVLIPTPGQPEQQSLATYLSDKKLAYTVSQDEFEMSSVLAAVREYSFATFQKHEDAALTKALNEVVKAIGGSYPTINH